MFLLERRIYEGTIRGDHTGGPYRGTIRGDHTRGPYAQLPLQTPHSYPHMRGATYADLSTSHIVSDAYACSRDHGRSEVVAVSVRLREAGRGLAQSGKCKPPSGARRQAAKWRQVHERVCDGKERSDAYRRAPMSPRTCMRRPSPASSTRARATAIKMPHKPNEREPPAPSPPSRPGGRGLLRRRLRGQAGAAGASPPGTPARKRERERDRDDT